VNNEAEIRKEKAEKSKRKTVRDPANLAAKGFTAQNAEEVQNSKANPKTSHRGTQRSKGPQRRAIFHFPISIFHFPL
jgi:hypothetical protein